MLPWPRASRYWALALPTHLFFTGATALALYLGVNLLFCRHLDDRSTISDRRPQPEDMPIELVNQLLYRHRSSSSGDGSSSGTASAVCE